MNRLFVDGLKATSTRPGIICNEISHRPHRPQPNMFVLDGTDIRGILGLISHLCL
jgi:hypothetical protein